jgi:hypothetical protein
MNGLNFVCTDIYTLEEIFQKDLHSNKVVSATRYLTTCSYVAV